MDYDISEFPETAKKPYVSGAHYYGDYVRRLFILGSALMIASYAFFQTYVNLPVSLSIFIILVLILLAGLQNPNARWIVILNTVIAVIACAGFEYKAVTFYSSTAYSLSPLFFWANQILALVFFVAIYYSTKTLRATLRPPTK